VARSIEQLSSGTKAVLCERNMKPGYKADGLILKLAQSRGDFMDKDATEGLHGILRDWLKAHPHVPVTIGQHVLLAQQHDDCALVPQGVYIMGGTKRQGVLLEASSSPMTYDRPVPLRSLSKVLACVTLLALQDRGHLSLHDPLAKHLPEFDTADKASITLQQVMTHSGGFTSDMDTPVMSDPDISLGEAARHLATDQLTFKVGDFHYSNTGFQLLGAVAEAVTGKTWHEVFHELVAEPLGLTSTWFVNTCSEARQPRNPNLATGGISSPSDMQRFLYMLMHEGAVPPDSTSTTASTATTIATHDGSGAVARRVLSVESYRQLVAEQSPGSVDRSCRIWGVVAPESAAHILPKVQEQVDVGLISQADAQLYSRMWANAKYGLGCWLSRDAETGKQHIALVGNFNTYIAVHDAESEDPLWVMYFAFSHICGCLPTVGPMLTEALEQGIKQKQQKQGQ